MTEILDKELAENSRKPKRRRFIHLLWILGLFLLGRLFSTMHWPGGAVMLIGSMSIMAGFFIAELFAWERNKLQLNILFIVCAVMDVYYLFSKYDMKGLIYLGLPCILLSFFIFLIPVLKERKDRDIGNLDI